jgi:hypothetical protein
MDGRRWWVLLGALVIFSLARVATTHRVFSQTSDEPWHVAAGYDLLKSGSYLTDTEHPPLARVLFGLPFLNTPEPAATDARGRGNALLFRNDRYTQNLARARLGNLVLLALAIVTVALWGREVLSPAGGLIAALLLASLPPVLAHSGVAATDAAITATLGLALYALSRLLDRKTGRDAVLLGVAVAAGLLSKYSFLLYFPVCAVMLMLVRRRVPSMSNALVAITIAGALVWGCYGFTFSTLAAADPRAEELARDVLGSSSIATALPVPAPLFVTGALAVKRHDNAGHPSFLFGRRSARGWWYYFPVALFFKTPVPFLILSLAGCAVLARRRAEIVLIAAGILAAAMTSNINIGVRHVLPIYVPLAIAAAAAVTQYRRPKWAAPALIVWLVAGSALAHPDYLASFNFMAGRNPEHILNDSNLDWGQDVLRLVRISRSMEIDQLTVSLFTTTELDKIGLPPHTELQALSEVHGWLALSEMNIALGRAHSPEVREWVDNLIGKRPYRQVGKSIRLYFIP